MDCSTRFNYQNWSEKFKTLRDDMDKARLLEHFFQTIGKENRIKIIRFIGNEERSVSEIVAFTGLSQPLVSHHLKTLRNNGILVTQRNGPFIYYRLTEINLLDLLDQFQETAHTMKHVLKTV